MIESITLSDFRNHTLCKIKTHGRRNVIITGPNGAGKTAVIEAVSMLGGDRGLRSAQMCDIARFGASGNFSVFAQLCDNTDITLYYHSDDTNRRAKIDGDSAPLADLAKIMHIVWITPREDRLFVDTIADRRTFFDRLVTSFEPSHSGRVARLSKLMSERAFALKNGNNKYWIDALDDQIAGVAVSVAVARIQYAGQLNYFLENCAVSVDGMLEKMLVTTPASVVEREYSVYLHNNRELNGDKMVLDGPHKSDFGVFNIKLNLPAFLTSTGQQKSALLDLILAHARLIHTKTTYQPVILLDEADAHLDENARKKLFVALGDANAQVWATGLDANVFADVPNAVFVTCANGEISNILVPRD